MERLKSLSRHAEGVLDNATRRVVRLRKRLRQMCKTPFSEFPWWHLTPIYLPERSTLYAPSPIGIGTAFGESLTSYLARLVEAHCVCPDLLLQKMIVPLKAELETQGSEAGEHPLWRRDGSGSHLINIIGPRARSDLCALKMLALRTDLRGLSLTALTKLLPIRGLTRNTLAWCPCLLRGMAGKWADSV
jgi:hypothetical protein